MSSRQNHREPGDSSRRLETMMGLFVRLTPAAAGGARADSRSDRMSLVRE